MRVVRDAERFQAWMHAQQHPPDCASARIYQMQDHPYGLGSELHVQAHSLLEALAAGFVLVPPTRTVYVNPRRCRSGGWTCLFRPLTTCDAADARAAAARNPPSLPCGEALNRSVTDALEALDTPERAPLAACAFAQHKSDNVFQVCGRCCGQRRARASTPRLDA